MFGLGVAFNDVPVYQQAQGFFAGGTNLFASQASYDAHSFRSKKLLTQAVASTLGITNKVATTNPPGTVTLKDGTLGYGAHNTWLQSSDLSNAAHSWTGIASKTVSATAAPAGYNPSAYSIVEDSSNGGHFANCGYVNNTGVWCLWGVFKANGRNWVGLQLGGSSCFFDLANGALGTTTGFTASITALGSGWYLCVASKVPSNNNSFIQFASANVTTSYQGDGVSGILIAAVQTNRGSVPLDYVPTTTAAVYGPRFTHDKTNSTYFGLYGVYPQAGLLREVARTNVATRSEEFDHATYTKAGATTVTANAAIAPNGTMTADKIIPGANGSSTAISRSDGLQGSGKTMSVYLKAGEITVVKGQDGAGQEWTADLATGVLSGVSAVWASPKLKPVGAGWFRLCLTNAGAAADEFYLGSSAGAGGSNGFYIWGLQVETGTFETSYIGPVISAAVTRDADLIRPPTTWVSAAGPETLCVEFSPAIQTPAASSLLVASTLPGAAAYQGTGGDCGMYDGTNAVTSGGSNKAVVGATNRLATRWGASAMAISFNGAAVVTGSFDGSMGAGGAVGIGDDGAGGNGFSGLITRISIAPKVATDTQLQQLSAGLL